MKLCNHEYLDADGNRSNAKPPSFGSRNSLLCVDSAIHYRLKLPVIVQAQCLVTIGIDEVGLPRGGATPQGLQVSQSREAVQVGHVKGSTFVRILSMNMTFIDTNITKMH